MSTYTVGQRLFWKANAYRGATDMDIEVTKVGRRWVEWKSDGGWTGRFDKVTGYEEASGISRSGRVWPSRQAWEQRAMAEAAIVALYHCTSGGGLPSDVPFEAWTLLRSAADAIGVGDRWRAEFESRSEFWRSEP